MMTIEFSSAAIKTAAFCALAIATLALPAAPASADPNHEFVVNGGFEQATKPSGQLGSVTQVTGWTSTISTDLSLANNNRYTFLGNATDFTTTGVYNGYREQYLKLWGPETGSSNGFAGSPLGGNFIAANGTYFTGATRQLIEGLTVGQTYNLSFDWAGAQQYGFDGATTVGWRFGLTGDLSRPGITGSTPIVANENHGFVDWTRQTFDFVADSSSAYLYFIAKGAPQGQPPMSLLDNVSLTGPHAGAVPEPATWAMMIVGFGAVGGVMRRHAREQRPARGR